MYVTTQDHGNVDLKPATASLVHETTNLVHDKSSDLTGSLISDKSLCLICPAYGPVYIRASL